MKEIMIHLRTLVYEKIIKSEWSRFLSLVQRIMNYSVDGSIGTQPAESVIRGNSIFRYCYGLAFGIGKSRFARVPLQAS